MPLRTRLTLLISLLTLVALVLGLWMVIHNARVAVEAELRSASDLTVQLVQASLETLGEISDAEISEDELLDQIRGLGSHRHIRLELYKGEHPPPPADAEPPRAPAAPFWFTQLVKPPVKSFHRTLPISTENNAWFVVHAEPADEITEAWQGSRGLLGLLLAFAIVANVLIHLVLNRALRPMREILEGLDRLEHGNYAISLPEFTVPEFNSVSRQFNRLSAALEQSRASNRRLNRRILEVQEEERRHLARELHDEMGQCMSAIRAEAVAIGRGVGKDDTRTRESAEAIARTASQVYGLTRNMIQRLHPAALDELGLEAALRQMVSDWARRNPGMHCDLEVSGNLERAPRALAIHVYRAVQECLTNVVRHAGADSVTVSLHRRDGAITATIRDTGQGFNVDASGGGFGLLGIRERFAGLGGSVTILSKEGEGTEVRLWAPERENVPSADEEKGGLVPEPNAHPAGHHRRRKRGDEEPSTASRVGLRTTG